MISALRASAVVGFALILGRTGWGITIPAGTEIQVRLVTEASSEKPPGQAVSAVVVVPVFIGGAAVIPSRTPLSGNTADANPFQAADDQNAEKPATLRISFTNIQDAVGNVQPIFCVLEGVDNARESVDKTGLITGISASQTIDAQIDRGITKLESRYQQFAQLLSGLKGALVKQVDASIDYKPGTDITIKLTKPLEWKSLSPVKSVGSINPPKALDALVNQEPFRTVAQNPPEPSDMTNLMFIGTAQQIQAAFQSAGWFSATALSQSAKMETARAIIENRGYSEAPMSILYLDGRAPDFTFQKQNNTFAMRHHIRIWQRPQSFDGKPVWVAAATHDTSITFSQVSRSFTHGIDPNIDLERSKVVNDLLFTGSVLGVALADRQGIPPDLSNATGDKLVSDGKMAVLEF